MELIKQITEEQLKIVRKNQTELDNTLLRIGILESQKHAALHSLAEINKKNEEYKIMLEEEYGSININLEDGSYTIIEKDK